MNADTRAPAARCPRCGSARNTAQTGRLCPRCLLDAALDLDDTLDVDAFADADASDTQTPRRVGGYPLLGEIARGGAGIVYRAWQPELKREVALKMLLSGRLESREALDRFHREAELMASLDHPGILPVYEVGTHADVPWFSMKLAEGGNLAERTKALHGRHEDIARLLAEVARAVDHAHRRGVLHRDLKPSNIVFDRDDHALVTDFGLARRLSVDSTLTGIDALIGTPRYVAPEVLTKPGVELTAAVDIYGLGAILYELLSGVPPLSELTAVQILQQIATRRPRPPRQLDAAIPAALEAICLRCLEKRPEDRYPSAGALASALDTWLARNQPTLWTRLLGRKLALPSRRRRAGWVVAVLLVAVLAATGSWYALREPIPTPDPAIATRTVAVLPSAVQKASPAERQAARQLATHLRLSPPLRLLPFEPTLATLTSTKVPVSDNDADAVLGALLFVEVTALPGNAGFVVTAYDDLREERLYEATFNLADVSGAAQRLADALQQRRQQATAEARLPRRALASLLRAIGWLRTPSTGTATKAIAALKDVITKAPDSALSHAWLAFAYLHHGGESFWLDSAIDEAARAQRMDPSLGMAQGRLGLAYYRKGWFTRAETAYERSRELGSMWVDAELALLYYETGRFDDSYRTWRDDERFVPEDKWGKASIAQLLLTVGETAAGERAMRTAMALEPNPAQDNLREAEIALYRRDAARCRQLASTIDPETNDGYFTASALLRTCAAKQGDFAGALATTEATKRAYSKQGDAPNSNNPALQEAILLAQLNRNDKVPGLLQVARQGLQAAIDSNNEYSRLWLRMAAAQRLGGETDAAYETLEHAFSLGLTVGCALPVIAGEVRSLRGGTAEENSGAASKRASNNACSRGCHALTQWAKQVGAGSILPAWPHPNSPTAGQNAASVSRVQTRRL